MSKDKTMLKRISISFATALVALTVATASAGATTPIASFEASRSTSSAGTHPDLVTSFELAAPGAPEAAKSVSVNFPEGLFGNGNAIVECRSVDFALNQCAPSSQAGIATVYANYGGDPHALMGTAPIFFMAPGPGDTARFGFYVPTINVPISIPLTLRTGSDYGMRFTVSGIPQSTPLAGAKMTFWGFPADASHNPQRFPKGKAGAPPVGCPGLADTTCLSAPTPPLISSKPLIDNPSVCGTGALPVELSVRTYQDPDNPASATSSFSPTTDCDRPTFRPVLSAGPTTTEADSASGLDLELKNRQSFGRPASPSYMHDVTVTLPEEFTINPGAADGQRACSDAEANFGTEQPSNCPDDSKIGTFSLGTPGLAGPLEGSLYLGEPKPGNTYRIFMAASGYGINAKLAGSLRPDPATGRLTATFDDLPQVPFDTFDIHLFASDRGLLATPTRCGAYKIEAHFVPWNNLLADETSVEVFGIQSGPQGSPCPAEGRPFAPRLQAGTANSQAGAFSNFTLKLDRSDGDQFLRDVNFTLPPGFTGSLRGIPYCSEAAIAHAAQSLGLVERANPSCPAAAQIGTSDVAAGPGGHPFHAAGTIYLAGPHNGAPLSLVVITPALAGPYDYGTVVVRVALRIDPLDAHVIATSDPVPSIIGGIPLRIRSIQVNVDRPNFTINPTNCSPFSIASQGVGDQGAVANFSSYFHVVNCATLPFKPSMTIKQLGGKGKTARAQDPSMQFDLTTRAGDANIKSVAVTLSKAFAIDQRHLGNLCSETELAKSKCAGRQAIGTASVSTPLLDAPLAGPVYAVSGRGGLPRLAFILDGQVSLVPRAESAATKAGALRTTVPTVPDAPVGKFRLAIFGGKRGYLTNTRSLCAAPVVSTIEFVGQNGMKRTQKAKAKTDCGAKAAKAKKRRR
jgi:hypothetical protein